MVKLTQTLRFLNNPGFKKYYYGLCGFNKFGLYRDDFYDYTDPVHLEAVRRLPPDLYDQLFFRIIRANQFEITKRFLPEDQQLSYEEHEEKGFYLQPYLERVKNEKKKKKNGLSFS